jgi:uncharacterized protein
MSEPTPSLVVRAALGLVWLYQKILSPVLHALLPGSGCRFQPTCSVYMATSLQRFGLIKGGWMGLKRIGRCHPWGKSGIDEVPPQ